MSFMHIHYRASDGEILGYENTQEPERQPGMETVTVGHAIPNPMLHKIDLATLQLIDKTQAERELAMRPPPVSIDEIRTAINTALCASDAYMMPDRPISEATRSAWVAYRQMLRDLSGTPTASEMIKAWTLDPNGNDAIPDLRARLAAWQ